MSKMHAFCLMALVLTLSCGVVSAQHINEHNGDPNGTPGTDANADGIIDGSQDEFVEIVNTTGATVNIGGWTLSDLVQVRHTFAAGTMLADGASITVFGGGSVTTFNTLGGGSGVTASTGSVGLNNGGDTITLVDSGSMVVDQVVYGTSGNGESMTRATDMPGDAFQLSFTDLAVAAGHTAGFQNDGTTPWLPATFAPPAPPSQIYINEYCNDPFSSVNGGLDTNSDGVVATSSGQSDDEFVEIVNAGPTSVDIGNWELTVNGGNRHTFAGGTTLPAGGAIVVFGGGDVTTFNTLGGATGVLSGNGFLGLGNSGGTIEILDDMAMVVNTVTYSSGTNQDGDGESVTRVTDLNSDALDLHTVVTAGVFHSAGFQVDGVTPFLPASLPLPVWPGNATDFRIETTINGAVQTSPTNVFTASDFAGINLFFNSPGGTTTLQRFSCFFSLMPTALTNTLSVDSVPGETGGFWLDQTGTFPSLILFDGMGLTSMNIPSPFSPLLPVGGTNYLFQMPAGLTGNSLMIQALVFEPGLNIVNFGIDDAIEIQVP